MTEQNANAADYSKSLFYRNTKVCITVKILTDTLLYKYTRTHTRISTIKVLKIQILLFFPF